uniref:DNA-directed DNA polymerase n=1 Tax=Ciona savignyi TaxID=51511 RepID=H2ZKD4_CIOSA
GRVVYGDTDSMFIALKPGTSKKEAFRIGRDIVTEVTNANPRPIKLKLEKIYQPCILQTKKRYVGYAYETEDQVEPTFDAKGIETVRRDGCPAVSKILEKSLRLLFESRDVSKVKSYVGKQCSKLMEGTANTQDCTIAKEYRGAKYYKPGAIVPALVLARKMVAMDKRSEPRVGERVPYVIVHGAPGTPLYQLCHPPQDLLGDLGLRLNGTYYITKMVLPALDRMMSLLGVDVFQWLRELPRTRRLIQHPKGDNELTSATISQYFESKHCLLCAALSKQFCPRCLSRENITAVKLMMQSRALERKKAKIDQLCMHCTGSPSEHLIKCICLDCPVLYKRFKIKMDETRATTIRRILSTH